MATGKTLSSFMNHNTNMREGDIGFTQFTDKKFYPFKILKIETWSDNSVVCHVITYNSFDNPPTKTDIKSFKIISWHAPIANLEKEAKFIANIPVTNDELEGYFEYLKQTDFPRYMQESGKIFGN